MKKIIAITFIAILLASTMILTAEAAENPEVTVYFFDVGQGDSILITMDGKNILIDGGPTAAGSTL
ncbi:MBL fold metallo-hydrolase, partial [Candidatus Bathyarchaeota archaeon]|nr:MBL fold metallo-hydrolase [Candidatus Bathyarchaeota archaeon]